MRVAKDNLKCKMARKGSYLKELRDDLHLKVKFEREPRS